MALMVDMPPMCLIQKKVLEMTLNDPSGQHANTVKLRGLPVAVPSLRLRDFRAPNVFDMCLIQKKVLEVTLNGPSGQHASTVKLRGLPKATAIDNWEILDHTTTILDAQQHDTETFWYNWISKSKCRGKWYEVASRSLMILKLITFEPSGAIIAAPMFSIPEEINPTKVFRLLIRYTSPAVPFSFLRPTLSHKSTSASASENQEQRMVHCHQAQHSLVAVGYTLFLSRWP